MNYQPEIAIVEANTLTCLGLKGILEEMIPMATIRTFHHFSELMDDTPDMYATISFPHRFTWSTMLSFSPGNEKRLYWQATVRNSNCPAYLYSTFTNPKKSW